MRIQIPTILPSMMPSFPPLNITKQTVRRQDPPSPHVATIYSQHTAIHTRDKTKSRDIC